jgi:hypothetical protein
MRLNFSPQTVLLSDNRGSFFLREALGHFGTAVKPHLKVETKVEETKCGIQVGTLPTGYLSHSPKWASRGLTNWSLMIGVGPCGGQDWPVVSGFKGSVLTREKISKNLDVWDFGTLLNGGGLERAGFVWICGNKTTERAEMECSEAEHLEASLGAKAV